MKAQALQSQKAAPPLRRAALQRKCDCGNHSFGEAECESCARKKRLQRRAAGNAMTACAGSAGRAGIAGSGRLQRAAGPRAGRPLGTAIARAIGGASAR